LKSSLIQINPNPSRHQPTNQNPNHIRPFKYSIAVCRSPISNAVTVVFLLGLFADDDQKTKNKSGYPWQWGHRRSKAAACPISRTLPHINCKPVTYFCLRGKRHRERLRSTACEAYQRTDATAASAHLSSQHFRLYSICHNGSPAKKDLVPRTLARRASSSSSHSRPSCLHNPASGK
jgi:hypothetical protein